MARATAPFGDGPDAPLYADFMAKVASLNISQIEDLLIADAAPTLKSALKQPYKALISAMTTEKVARTSSGVWHFKDGALEPKCGKSQGCTKG